MTCKLCKTKEATQSVTTRGKTLFICNSCYIDIVSAFSYHIGNKEVTKEEYEKRIKND